MQNQAAAALTKPFDSPAHSTPDFSANATYILHPDGGAITLLYYHGNVATPTHCTDGTAIGKTNATTGQVCGVTASTAAVPFGTVGNAEFDFSKATAFRNNFDRVAVYASYPVGKRFLPQGGFQFGRDTTPVNPGAFPTISTLQKFDSKGAFAEGAFVVNQYLTAGARYDWYKPSSRRRHSTRSGLSLHTSVSHWRTDSRSSPSTSTGTSSLMPRTIGKTIRSRPGSSSLSEGEPVRKWGSHSLVERMRAPSAISSTEGAAHRGL